MAEVGRVAFAHLALVEGADESPRRFSSRSSSNAASPESASATRYSAPYSLLRSPRITRRTLVSSSSVRMTGLAILHLPPIIELQTRPGIH